MRRVYTLIFAGCISCAGFTVQAQSIDIDSVIQSLTSGGASQGISISDIVGGVTSQIMDTAGPAGQQTSAIEGPLVVDTAVPEVNQTVAGVIIGDAQTGRYPPRLTINFTEFPLRSLAAAHGRSVEAKTQAEIVVQRIQTRLREPKIDLVVKDRTAILSGTVATDRQRDLAESMLRFEPGIDVVQNEIIVVKLP